MTDFIFGASGFACCVIALYFALFWRQTGDRLFLLFSLAFWAFAANRVAIAAVDDSREAAAYLYLIRLLAFGLIIAAIIDKNRPSFLTHGGRTGPGA